MLFDSHVHTEFSTDSEMKLTEALRAARSRGIGVITTEHMDLYFPEEGQSVFDEDAYFSAYQSFRGDDCLLGIELGMRDDCAAENRAIVESRPFDYVLGSVHLLDGQDLYYASVYEYRAKDEVYAAYFSAMLDCVRLHPFIDALAHIDYIARYAPYPEPELAYAAHADRIDSVLRALVDNGTLMEINTRRLRDQAVVRSLLPIYKRYAELGGAAVTLGSDAHGASGVGANFEVAASLAETCGLRPVYFKGRQMEYMTVK